MPSGKTFTTVLSGLLLVVALSALTVKLLERRAAQANPVVEEVDTPGPRVWYSPGQYPQLALPGGGKQTIQSVLNIKQRMRYGEFVWNEEFIPAGRMWVRVDLDRQLVSVFRGGHEIGTAVILYGADSKPTPAGTFPILQKDADYHSRTYDAPMPYMLRLTADGVAIHGSDVKRGSATHGCIGVPLEFARLLFGQMKLGDSVVILPHKA